jgi:molybdenum cofactor cytidylyltransferase
MADIVVVAKNDDNALHAAADRAGARVVRPAVDPPDMRASVEYGLDWVRRQAAPTAEDGWLLIPADHPIVDPAVLNELIARWQTYDAAIVLPTFEGRRGHPTLLPWALADEVASIPENQGLNWLVRQHAAATLELPVQTRSVLIDLDTPEEYAADLAEWQGRSANH